MQVQLSSSAIPEYTRNSAVLAIYGNQNNYLQVPAPPSSPMALASISMHDIVLEPATHYLSL